MQLFEQRMQQLMVTAMGLIFATRFAYFLYKAPDIVKQSHPGFAPVEQRLKPSDRVLFAWAKASTGK